MHITDDIEPAKLNSRDAVLALGTRTVDAVARQMHPGEKDPLWKFTVPEALALIERVSARARAARAREHSARRPPHRRPGHDHLPLALDHRRGGNAFDLWRVVRLMNPASAITQEMRENVTRQLYDWGREELGRRLAAAYVREVGRAAIDLYSGRLRVSGRDVGDDVTKATREDRAAPELAEPLRVLIAGPGRRRQVEPRQCASPTRSGPRPTCCRQPRASRPTS